MGIRNVFLSSPMAVAALFSLAWFLVGILVGRNMPKSAPRQPSSQRKGRSPERARGGGGEGDVELYVGNLSYDVGDKDVLKMFESYGKVVSGRIIQNRFNGKSKGYGFVEMADRNQALAAIRALNGKEIQGRRIVVNEAKSSARDR